MLARRWAWSCAILSALLAVVEPTSAMQRPDSLAPDADRVGGAGTPVRVDDVRARLEDGRQALARYDHGRARELESRYEQSGDPEKRLLERRFGVLEHRFRVDADPYELVRRWEEGLAPKARDDPSRLLPILEEITAGQHAAYYFFDAVIRPNVFAPDAWLQRRESSVHEKVHLIQPSVYKALGIRCIWIDSRDPCVRSLEPVAVYLTEYAMLKRSSPARSEASINRAIEAYLEREAERCGYPMRVPRCPAADQVNDYILLPRELARLVGRRGLEEGIRRFVAGLARPEHVALGR